MRLLLDTHALLWFAQDADRLSPAGRRAIVDSANVKYVSAASAWEIATKARLGKLDAGPLATNFVVTVEAEGFQILSITADHAQRAGGLVGAHGDPFDRMLAAQALRRSIALVSNDDALDAFGVTRVW